jgi:hypothetical protein
MSKCKKQSNCNTTAQRDAAASRTRANKIRKCESILRKCPHNIAVVNQLAQLRYDSGVK